ncbi:ferredoxin reductase domain-containing protein [Tsukamurella soli]|uniref:Uncharacterized protein n=1 Tax=Tsukamurella soli TaxID=644556 RepID=A0ABP8J7V3_9ACTN
MNAPSHGHRRRQLPDGYRLAEGERRGRIDLGAVGIPDHGDIFLCGPGPFMESATRQLVDSGVTRDRVYFEAFTPLAG